MADSPVENPGTPDYPHEMETRVAILEHSTAELKFEIREGFNAIAAELDASDKAIANMHVAIQSKNADFQKRGFSDDQ
ncbi:MAG: hypothetical protein PHT60_13965 [Acidiphilium sp.]|nr:hypothetical protein [Acidiphilium sp.]MDD4936871.1 hypothetical protein [Acidiphilium sp.]